MNCNVYALHADEYSAFKPAKRPSVNVPLLLHGQAAIREGEHALVRFELASGRSANVVVLLDIAAVFQGIILLSISS